MDRRPSCFSFDLDGTLVLQDYPAKVRELQLIAEHHLKHNVDTADVQSAIQAANRWYERDAPAAVKAGEKDLWAEYARRSTAELAVSSASSPLIDEWAEYLRAFDRTANNFFVPPRALVLLEYLAAYGARLFIVSANIGAEQRLRLVGLNSLFKRVLSPADGTTKADLFQRLLQLEEIEAGELLHIGDDPHSDRVIPARYRISSFLILDSNARAHRHEIDRDELSRRVDTGYRRLAEYLSLNDTIAGGIV